MSQLIQVINSGSSSIKYSLLEVHADGAATVWAHGLVEAIGEPASRITHHTRIGRAADADFANTALERPIADHLAGFELITHVFAETGPVAEVGQLVAFGHRVVHGGDHFAAPALIDDAVIAAITDCIPLAPLHNPANLAGIRAAQSAHPDLPQVAVFDTAFHQTMPPASYTYAIDREVARSQRIRRYGFHGTSHAYVSRKAIDFLNLPHDTARVITLHLGNGASACATLGGVSIDTSMGFTPLEGLVMGTRSGDLDPAIIFHLEREAQMSVAEVDALLNKSSGLKGLCGANDLRDIHRMASTGDADAQLALDVYTRRIRSYLGSYLMELGGADAVVFTAGVGENDAEIRATLCADLAWLGVHLDEQANSGGRGLRRISTADSAVAVLVVPTNEEFEIAQQTLHLVNGHGES